LAVLQEHLGAVGKSFRGFLGFAVNIMTDIIAQTIRPAKEILDFSAVPDDVKWYLAGLFDAEGSVSIYNLTISQSQRGVACLHKVHEHFGGRITPLKHSGKATHQQAYCWITTSPEHALAMEDQVLGQRLILKKRELDIFVEYQRTQDVEKRQKLKVRLSELKKIQHDPIPEDLNPHLAYFGGFFDGEGCIDAHGKSSQHHTINQLWRPICDLFQRRFGGIVYRSQARERKRNDSWVWNINTFADDFVKEVAPYIVGKKAQVDLILAMKPGDAMDVHCKLRELKGNIGSTQTRKIDAHRAGESPSFARPPKELPRGVFAWNGKFIASIRHKKVQHNLGSFDTVEEAQAQYKHYKALVEAEKRGGPEVDLTFNTREARSKQQPNPPADLVLPKGIYLTAARTFQVRYHPGNKQKPHQLGTYRTVEEAQRVYDAYKLRMETAAAAPAPGVAT
jgi:hypothetical protein